MTTSRLYVIGPSLDLIYSAALAHGVRSRRDVVPIINGNQLRGLRITAYQVGGPLCDTLQAELTWAQQNGRITVIQGLPELQ